MLELDPEVTTWLAITACAVALLLGVAVLVLASKLRRLGRVQRRAFGGAEGEDVLGALGRHNDALGRLGDEVRHVDARLAELRDRVAGSVSKVGMVRYDAFEDMGGALSFSAALLDEHGTGLVISAINGRTETRCYAKPVDRERSEHNLSAEEAAAITTAVEDGGIGSAPVAARRRRRSS